MIFSGFHTSAKKVTFKSSLYIYVMTLISIQFFIHFNFVVYLMTSNVSKSLQESQSLVLPNVY